MKALIIDDSPSDAQTVVDNLRESLDEELAATCARNLQEAFLLLEKGARFDLCFIDLSLARGANPKEIVAALERYGIESSSVIFCTQNPAGEQAEQARKAARVLIKGQGDQNPNLLHSLVLDIQSHQRDRSLQYRQEFARIEGKMANLYHGLEQLLRALQDLQERLKRTEKTLYGNDSDGIVSQFRDLQRTDSEQAEDLTALRSKISKLEDARAKYISDFLTENAKGFWAVVGALAAGLLTWFLTSR
jgi:CheY-like chemotaxis protein